MQEYTGAAFDLGGLFVSAKATWRKDIAILTTTTAGVVPATSFAGEAWQLSLAKCSSDSYATITTANGISFDSTTAILSLNVGSTAIDFLCGDYDADLSSASSSGVVTHHAHGRVTFIGQPIRSS